MRFWWESLAMFKKNTKKLENRLFVHGRVFASYKWVHKKMILVEIPDVYFQNSDLDSRVAAEVAVI